MDQTQQPPNQPTINSAHLEIEKAHKQVTLGLILSVLLPPVGLVISYIAYHKLEDNQQNSGLALSGIIVGCLMTALTIVFCVIMFTVVNTWNSIISNLAR